MVAALAWFVYEGGNGSSDNSDGVVVGLLCAKKNVAGSNLALYVDFYLEIF